MPIDDIYISYTNIYDKDLQLINGNGDITSYITDEMLEQENPASVGSIIFNFYNTYLFNDNISLIVSADAISGDEEYMIHTLLEGNHEYDLEFGGKVVTLDRIIIDNQYYSERLERLILKEFIDYCNYMMFDYLVVIAAKPVSCNKSTRIVEFPQIKMYEDFNFVNLGGTEKRAPVMVKNLNLLD
ncbi:hypothetical protein [Pseudogracilibacillus sp. SO30301A]|uniref:hypothetical protein n=1 Tax=Pseudogracilibacillus sp. SO30301A TaxID=3098291 RepID=UPI00300DD197